MILATIEGQLVFIVIMAIIGLINWVTGKLNSGGKPGPKPPPTGTASAPGRANAESEEERMRRFLEALGLPSDAPPSPPKTRAAQPQLPPIVSPPKLPNAPRREVRPTAPVSIPQPRASFRPEVVTRAETIALPQLTVPTVPEFETISSKVAAVPIDFPAPREESERAHGPTLNETLRAALASPQQLRSAFILSEIFGTPPGLRQS